MWQARESISQLASVRSCKICEESDFDIVATAQDNRKARLCPHYATGVLGRSEDEKHRGVKSWSWASTCHSMHNLVLPKVFVYPIRNAEELGEGVCKRWSVTHKAIKHDFIPALQIADNICTWQFHAMRTLRIPSCASVKKMMTY